eukprot:jgi/Psemu1/250046/estExt_Genewise1Plus.C_110159
MASKTGSFLRKSDRQKILRDLHQKPESVRSEAAEVVASSSNSSNNSSSSNNNHIDSGCTTPKPTPLIDGHGHAVGDEPFGTGCLSCGRDDDHANLLLCETCEAEYHTYCLDPPLGAVPAGDWFCGTHQDDDGLEALVSALAPSFTSRFGEVCWAQGEGVGFGWWPAFIYDPRLTIGTARELARKNLGKKHLVYFFGCNDAPFSVLTNAKTTKWNDGLIDDFHLGKTARSAGQKRANTFQDAMQAAVIELARPVEMRMDWKNLSFALDTLRTASKRNTNANANANAVNPIVESSEDGELVVKILRKEGLPTEEPPKLEDSGTTFGRPLLFTNIGFLKLASRKTNTFSDARAAIRQELVPDAISATAEWRFFVPGLGPVMQKQEAIMGPIYSFLRKTTRDSNLGDGTLMHPLKLFIVELRVAGNSSDAQNSMLGTQMTVRIAMPKDSEPDRLCW